MKKWFYATHSPFKRHDILVVLLGANPHYSGDQLRSEMLTNLLTGEVANQTADDFHQRGTRDHSVEKIQRSQTNRLITIIETGENEILVGLNALGMVT